MQHVRHKRTQLTDAHLTGFRRSEPGEHETYDALKKSEKKFIKHSQIALVFELQALPFMEGN
jgi:hypothetical protein